MKKEIGKIAGLLDAELLSEIKSKLPAQPNEFTIMEYVEEFGIESDHVARKQLAKLVDAGKLIVRKVSNQNHYSKPE